MTTRLASRPWNAQEDTLLREAVALHGENDNWKTIALQVPGRTNKACRKRWLHSLSPNVKKSAWTQAEDRLLLELYAIHSIKWAVIARQIPGRTDDACSKRYREALDPSLKKDDWTPAEDIKLLECLALSSHPVKWGQVGQELRRSGLGCRNRWRLLERKRLLGISSQSPPTSGVVADTLSPLRDQSSPIEWPSFSMLDVNHYWAGDNSQPPYDDENSTLPSGSHIRTQDVGSSSLTLPQTRHIANDSMHALEQYTTHYQYNPYSLSPALSAVRDSHSPIRFHSDLGSPDDDQSMSLPSFPLRSFGSQDMQLPPINESTGRNLPMTTIGSHDVPRTLGQSATSVHRLSLVTTANFGSQPGPIQDSGSYSNTMNDGLQSNDASPTESSNSLLPLPSPSSSDASTTSLLEPINTIQPGSSAPRPAKTAGSLRLNGDLPVTSNPTVLPYACGHRRCWHENSTKSSACYSTSRELNDHSKSAHWDDLLGGGKPFRCGLDGCPKSWKSINGLQYHLQVSKAHFQNALSSIVVSAHTSSIASATFNTLQQPASKTGSPSKKLHLCPHHTCPNQYKQLSGLRYHLVHGHPDPQDAPVQLDVVPPSLARKIAEKASTHQASHE